MGLCTICSGLIAHSSICPSSPLPQAQATEAAQQLAEANSRYRTALEQLQAERARADALQVRCLTGASVAVLLRPPQCHSRVQGSSWWQL